MPDLKPSPFCGEPPQVRHYEAMSLFSSNVLPWTSVRCWRCDVEFAREEGMEPDAITKWNTRA